MACTNIPHGSLGDDPQKSANAVAFLEYMDCLACERQKERDVIAGVFGVATGLYLSNKAYDRYKLATDKLKAIAERQQVMGLTLKDHYITVTHLQKMKALCDTIDMDIPGLSELAAHARWEPKVSELGNQAHAWRNQLIQRYNIRGVPDCAGREINIAEGVAMANSGYAAYRFGERRTERRRAMKIGYMQRAHAASYTSPSPIFGMMNDASQVYGGVFQNASNNLGGGLSLIGSGITNLFGGLVTSTS